MSQPATRTDESGDILKQLNQASSAEEFFALLGVAYDPKVLSVVRLHILRRMGQYLVNESFDGLDDSGIAQRCKEFLTQAYADFVASSPLDQRVFKVLKEAVAKPKTPVFVPLTDLK
jgi:nitrogenase-stabilizing/protective protein